MLGVWPRTGTRLRSSFATPTGGVSIVVAGLVSLALGPLAAQRPAGSTEVWDDGPLIGVPFACVVNGLGSTPGPRRIHSKKAGFAATAPRVMAPASGPDLRFERMFRNRLTGNVPPGFEIDAFSIGLDVLWIDSSGQLTPPSNSWTGILLSFKPESASARTTSGVLLREDSNPDGAGTDVFDFVFDLPTMQARLYRELDGTELGFSDGTTASAAGQINGLDLHLTAWDLDPGIVSSLPTNPRVFFSVPAAAVSAVPPLWWPASERNGATILYSEWNGVDWTTPQVFATAADLFLDPTDDVDALAVEWLGNSNTKIVYSTQPVAGRDQLLFRQLGTDGDPQPVRVSGSTSATTAAGAGSADVAAVCFYDPGVSSQGACTQTLRWSYVLGTPKPFLNRPNTTLAASMIRGCSSAGDPEMKCMAAGWPPPGRGPGWGVIALGVGSEDVPPANWFVLSFPRALTALGGDPMTFPVPLPDWTWNLDPARCMFLWSAWAVTDSSLTTLTYSRAVRVRL